MASDTTSTAHFKLLEARRLRDKAPDFDAFDDRAQLLVQDASDLEIEAANALYNIGATIVGGGGELIAKDASTAPAISRRVAKPSQIALNAAVERLNLIHDNDVFDLAIDTAESVGAETAVEKMLAHQMAAAHKTAMALLERNKMICDPIDEVRRVNAAARLMTVFQGGALALQRLRTGGRQVLTVQHVTVANGGQAVIGNMGTPIIDRSY